MRPSGHPTVGERCCWPGQASIHEDSLESQPCQHDRKTDDDGLARFLLCQLQPIRRVQSVASRDNGAGYVNETIFMLGPREYEHQKAFIRDETPAGT